MLQLRWTKNLIEAGVDEAGRGALAGPVVAAAVILPDNFYHPLLNDSKQMSKTDREMLRGFIEANAVHFAVAEVSQIEIDQINILQASIKAMHLALDQLKTEPELILVDGNRFIPYKFIPHQCIVKGDSKMTSIAAASVLAKTYRDELMKRLALEHPEFGWDKNAAYPTKYHRKAIEQFGSTPYHRLSFSLQKQVK
jgi:ribonuclease HII